MDCKHQLTLAISNGAGDTTSWLWVSNYTPVLFIRLVVFSFLKCFLLFIHWSHLFLFLFISLTNVLSVPLLISSTSWICIGQRLYIEILQWKKRIEWQTYWFIKDQKKECYDSDVILKDGILESNNKRPDKFCTYIRKLSWVRSEWLLKLMWQ